MDIHAPHDRYPEQSLCGDAGLISNSPIYIVTCHKCKIKMGEKSGH